uniref:HTH psq-type domain-containing protein n=1 Tax=Parascaris univalens TaxID=6257 RepID=A0A914ZUD1_PARUN
MSPTVIKTRPSFSISGVAVNVKLGDLHIVERFSSRLTTTIQWTRNSRKHPRRRGTSRYVDVKVVYRIQVPYYRICRPRSWQL